MVLEKIEPQEKGGYVYRKITEVETNDAGDWVLKNIPPEWCRLVLTADGYASRVIGHRKFDDQPGWSESNFGLVKTGTLSGRVVDQKGQPLAAVDVRLENLNLVNSKGYEIPGEAQVQTDDQGRFEMQDLPVGTGRIWFTKEGYVRPGLGPDVEIPSSDAKFVMVQAARLHVTVDFSATNRPAEYLVHCEPEGGEQVGKWSGDGKIGSSDDITYESIPPGRYLVKGRPNPGNLNQQTKAILVELKGGETAEVTIKAK
jgi:hypothetical protein